MELTLTLCPITGMMRVVALLAAVGLVSAARLTWNADK